MFPYSQHFPTLFSECARYFPVPINIPLNLLLPVLSICFGHAAALGVTVPKTAVHEDSDFRLAEYEIRFPQQGIVPAPPGNVVFAKDGPKAFLG